MIKFLGITKKLLSPVSHFPIPTFPSQPITTLQTPQLNIDYFIIILTYLEFLIITGSLDLYAALSASLVVIVSSSLLFYPTCTLVPLTPRPLFSGFRYLFPPTQESFPIRYFEQGSYYIILISCCYDWLPCKLYVLQMWGTNSVWVCIFNATVPHYPWGVDPTTSCRYWNPWMVKYLK